MFQKGERMASVKFAQYQGTDQFILRLHSFLHTVFLLFLTADFSYSIDGKAVDIEIYSAVTDELEFISPIRFQSKTMKKKIWSLLLCIQIFLYISLTC